MPGPVDPAMRRRFGLHEGGFALESRRAKSASSPRSVCISLTSTSATTFSTSRTAVRRLWFQACAQHTTFRINTPQIAHESCTVRVSASPFWVFSSFCSLSEPKALLRIRGHPTP